MSKSIVIEAAKAFFEARGTHGFVDGINGLHFNARIGHKERECFLVYDGRHELRFSVVVGATLPAEELELLHRAFLVISEYDGFYGMLYFGEGHLLQNYRASLNPARDSVEEVLKGLITDVITPELRRVDAIYYLVSVGRSPREIAELDLTFGNPAGTA